jgi:hypothetical protein
VGEGTGVEGFVAAVVGAVRVGVDVAGFAVVVVAVVVVVVAVVAVEAVVGVVVVGAGGRGLGLTAGNGTPRIAPSLSRRNTGLVTGSIPRAAALRAKTCGDCCSVTV